MKKIFLLAIAALLSASAAIADDEKITDLEPKKLPPIAQNIIRAYFPETQIILAQKKKSKVRHNFEVHLDNGTEIQFDKDGQWTLVDCGELPIPQRMIPGKIQMFLNEKIHNPEVKKMFKDQKGYYNIILMTGQTLLFDNQFRFIPSE